MALDRPAHITSPVAHLPWLEDNSTSNLKNACPRQPEDDVFFSRSFRMLQNPEWNTSLYANTPLNTSREATCHSDNDSDSELELDQALCNEIQFNHQRAPQALEERLVKLESINDEQSKTIDKLNKQLDQAKPSALKTTIVLVALVATNFLLYLASTHFLQPLPEPEEGLLEKTLGFLKFS